LNPLDQTSALALARTTLQQEIDALHELAGEVGAAYWEAARLIAGCPGIVWVTGVGTSAAVGQRFAHILTDCGARSMFLSPDIGRHGHSGAMTSGEVLVAISRGGESAEVNEMVEIANRRGLTTLGFLHEEQSCLARLCQHILPIHSPAEYELGGYCATASTVACSAACDAISAIVLALKGYSPEEFAGTHPGGAVGRAHYPGPIHSEGGGQ